MKLCKNVLLESVQITENSIEVFVCANVNKENTSLFFSFSRELNCETFKRFCKTLGLTQTRTRNLLKETI